MAHAGQACLWTECLVTAHWPDALITSRPVPLGKLKAFNVGSRVKGVSSITWDRCCFLPWGFAVLTGLVTVGTPFTFCGDKDHPTVRKRRWGASRGAA